MKTDGHVELHAFKNKHMNNKSKDTKKPKKFKITLEKNMLHCQKCMT